MVWYDIVDFTDIYAYLKKIPLSYPNKYFTHNLVKITHLSIIWDQTFANPNAYFIPK